MAGQETALYIFLAILIAGSIALREFLYGTYSRIAGASRTPLMIGVFVFAFGYILLNTLLK
jgi:hypothetical protein